jgi:hypothetical protein
LLAWAETQGQELDYVILPKQSGETGENATAGNFDPLMASLLASAEFEPAHANLESTIY